MLRVFMFQPLENQSAVLLMNNPFSLNACDKKTHDSRMYYLHGPCNKLVCFGLLTHYKYIAEKHIAT